MPPNGIEEWRARIGLWENRKLGWYQAHGRGSRQRVPLHLDKMISEAPRLCLLMLLLLAGKVATGLCERGKAAFSSSARLAVRIRSCAKRSRKGWATPPFSLFVALSVLLIVAGDVETNPGPSNGERKH